MMIMAMTMSMMMMMLNGGGGDDGDDDGDGGDGDETTSPIRGHLFFPEQPTPSQELALIKLIQFPTK